MHEKTYPLAPLTVSVREACRLSGLGRTKIYELISDGRLTPVKIDRRTLIPFDDLAKLVSPERTAFAGIRQAG
jgi:excisionase family DNA binding protein